VKCEFSERNYEKSLDFELTSSNQIFSPTQNQEKVLGIDSALHSGNDNFWRILNPNWLTSPSVPIGTKISQRDWKWARGIPTIENLPKIRANVFLQYKIPEHISSNLGKEYSSWNSPYFRYDIVSHQNNALKILEKHTSHSAVVVYASPAFSTYDQLIDFGINCSLVSNSNFTKPSFIQNHRRYSYVDSGSGGCVHSKSTKIPKLDLKNEIINLANSSKNTDEVISLKLLSSQIDKTVSEYDEGYGKEYDKNFNYKFQKTREYFLKQQNENEDSKYLFNILAFTFQTNLSWLILS
jgi:hypothetical protein